MKKLLALLVAVILISGAAAYAVSPTEWILKYNQFAGQVNAPLFLVGEYEQETFDYGALFSFTENSYIALYIGSSGNADAVIVDVYEESLDAAAITAAAVAASDDRLNVSEVYEGIREAEKSMVEAEGEKYYYYEEQDWIYMIMQLFEDGEHYTSCCVVRKSAYAEIMGEEYPGSVEEIPDSLPDEIPDADEQPDNGSKNKPESEGDRRIHKI